MAIILYEGFNFATSDSPKLDTNYWSTNNIAGISYTTGRTDNEVVLANYDWNNLSAVPTTLVLSNFPDPLATNNCFGMGISHDNISLATQYSSGGQYPFPFRSKYMEFRDTNNNLVLSFNFIRTTYQGNNSMGLEVVQNSNVVTVYDFASYSGRSWGIVADAFNGYIMGRVYLEFFIDAKNQNKMSIRVSQDGGTIHGHLLNSAGEIETTITPFSSLGSATWFAKNSATGTNMKLDDFYFSRGDTSSECYLGSSTRIYRLNLTANGSTLQWTANNSNSQFSNLNNSDGDANYIYSSINNSGDTSIFDLANLPVNPSDVSIIVKPINIMRKTGDTNIKFTNVMSSGSGPIVDLGPEQIISSSFYSTASSLITINPITGNPWTVNDINNMQIGIRNLGPAT